MSAVERFVECITVGTRQNLFLFTKCLWGTNFLVKISNKSVVCVLSCLLPITNFPFSYFTLGYKLLFAYVSTINFSHACPKAENNKTFSQIKIRSYLTKIFVIVSQSIIIFRSSSFLVMFDVSFLLKLVRVYEEFKGQLFDFYLFHLRQIELFNNKYNKFSWLGWTKCVFNFFVPSRRFKTKNGGLNLYFGFFSFFISVKRKKPPLLSLTFFTCVSLFPSVLGTVFFCCELSLARKLLEDR